MSEARPTIAALRAWLKTCPLIAEEQEATGAAFRIAGLDEDATAFSIEDSPGNPVITEYFSGRDMAKNYLFLSRREYGEADVLTVQNSGFFEQLTDWVMAQNDCRHLPALEAPRQPLGVSVTSTGYIVTSSAGSCRMQMQLRLTYYQPK
nr:MAG TPA: Minor capsid protein from bacteriophage [Caudoviricetes sp.]